MAFENFERQIRPIVVAHRGASAAYPENTLASFRGAMEAGADVVELDIRLTADNVAVILHDLDVSATTDGSGLVHKLTLEEVKRLDASGGQGPRAEVPTLREALELLTGKVGVDIEIKNLPGEPSFDSPREAAAQEAVRLLHETGFEGAVLISSFNWLSIERIQELDRDIPTGFLTTAAIDPWASLEYAKARGHAYVLPQASALYEAGESFVHTAHSDGINVGTWTVDDPKAIERLFGMGVDAVATNDPAAAVPIRDRFRDQPTPKSWRGGC
ncbi:MAG TPA: glycerophosphodiester phosphodiesterase family protein [Actinomycetota bacterium]|jgi:glycerophosphoryl diester phosphodiesterase